MWPTVQYKLNFTQLTWFLLCAQKDSIFHIFWFSLTPWIVVLYFIFFRLRKESKIRHSYTKLSVLFVLVMHQNRSCIQVLGLLSRICCEKVTKLCKIVTLLLPSLSSPLFYKFASKSILWALKVSNIASLLVTAVQLLQFQLTTHILSSILCKEIHRKRENPFVLRLSCHILPSGCSPCKKGLMIPMP